MSRPRSAPHPAVRSTRGQWREARASALECRFADVPAGRVAVAVVHDVNGNRRVDTNLVGLPTEQWGVSRGVRHALRAPGFDEAAITIHDTPGEVIVEVSVAR